MTETTQEQAPPDSVSEPDHLEEESEASEQSAPERHINTRILVFEKHRILYVPVPKAGCTSLMWALAANAGLDEERFRRSFEWEVTRSLTIHDLGMWPKEFRFELLPDERKEEILAAEDWFRFTVVRDPFRRLWSAWQSKILMNEPQFIKKFSGESWFPGSVGSAENILETFRNFLRALEQDHELVSADVHWAPQVALTSHGEFPYTHVGRVENLGDTVEALGKHVESVSGSTFPTLPRTNVTPLPYTPELFNGSDVKTLSEAFAEDIEAFGYKPPPDDALEAACPPSWFEKVDAAASALEEIRRRNERIADLRTLYRKRNNEMSGRIRRMKLRIERQAKLRAEEHRRNQRLQKRLRSATEDLGRLRSSASWRYTAPLRRFSALASRRGRRP